MVSVLGFLAVLAPLVVVHELGHYFFAILFGVKAEAFSIGFGPVVWHRRIGETDWRISLIPLGGYVKLLGSEPERELSAEEKKRALTTQAAWKRFLIFAGGPLFNFFWAILVFMAILLIGEPQVASVVGRVVKGSYAEKAGFRNGDHVLSIDGKTVRKFEDVLSAIADAPGRELVLSIKNMNDVRTLAVKPSAEPGFGNYGEETTVGEMPGLFPSARTTEAGVSSAESAAGISGIQTGDQIVAADGIPVPSWEALEAAYAGLKGGAPWRLSVESGKKKREVTLKKPTRSSGDLGQDLGLHSSEMIIEKVVSGSPAEKAGLLKGDRLVAVSAERVPSFFALRQRIQRAAEKDGKVTVEWERSGKTMTREIVPTVTHSRDPALRKTTQYTVGIIPRLNWLEPETVMERVWNPLKLVFVATERMVDVTWRNLVSIQKMFSGDVSVGTLGGPILIGKIAGESIARGLIAFLTTMAMLSVGLGVLNLLPVPVLDGGHLVLLGIEALRGKPLSLRQMEVVQQVGLSLILLLMVVVIRNDLARLPIFN